MNLLSVCCSLPLSCFLTASSEHDRRGPIDAPPFGLWGSSDTYFTWIIFLERLIRYIVLNWNL